MDVYSWSTAFTDFESSEERSTGKGLNLFVGSENADVQVLQREKINEAF